MASTLKILSLEPYLALSHRLFLEGLKEHSRHQWILESLPARKWKWRMRTAALAFAESITRHRPDLLLVSDYMNLAELAAITGALPPSIIYFHENQLNYPLQEGERRDHHFALTHLYAILSARAAFFNSRYHLESFLTELSKLVETIPDLDSRPFLRTVRDRAEVLAVGTGVGREPRHDEKAAPAAGTARKSNAPAPVILWAHRWEYDKDPDAFISAMETLAREGEDFRVRVLGQRFRTIPPALGRLKEKLGERLLDLRFLDDRREYLEAVAACDIVLSTARHEFFGLSTLEALRLGLYPVLPDDLAYPELLPPALRADRRFLYPRELGPLPALREALTTVRRTGPFPLGSSGNENWNEAGRKILSFTGRFHWSRLTPVWDERLEELALSRA